MSPVLETFANAAARGFGGIGAGGGGGLPNSYELISTILPSGNATITFSSIPSTYKHLQLRWRARSSQYADEISFYMTVNGDSGTNYSQHDFFGNGTNVYADANSTTSQIVIRGASLGDGTSGSTNVFAAGYADILDYTNVNKFKTVRGLAGYKAGSSFIGFSSGAWRNTAAITSLTIAANGGGTATLMSGSRVSLYGIKA